MIRVRTAMVENIFNIKGVGSFRVERKRQSDGLRGIAIFKDEEVLVMFGDVNTYEGEARLFAEAILDICDDECKLSEGGL